MFFAYWHWMCYEYVIISDYRSSSLFIIMYMYLRTHISIVQCKQSENFLTLPKLVLYQFIRFIDYDRNKSKFKHYVTHFWKNILNLFYLLKNALVSFNPSKWSSVTGDSECAVAPIIFLEKCKKLAPPIFSYQRKVSH